MNDRDLISAAFRTFATEAADHAAAWSQAVTELGKASVLDEKTAALGYVAVLAAAGLPSGMPFHVQRAKSAGASRPEVISAVLLGLPAVGNRVTQALPIALQSYDES